MPRAAYESIYELAADQLGYFTAAQALEVGVGRMAVVMMERRGTVQRLSRGVYRLVQFPIDPNAQYLEAALWPATTRGVVSHESALALYEISDVNPARIHITVPKSHRVRRPIPARLVIHHADLSDAETTVQHGIPVTEIVRTLLDCRSTGVGDDVLMRALVDAERDGLIGEAEARRVRTDFGLTQP